MRKLLVAILALAAGLGLASFALAATSTQVFNISVVVTTNTTTIVLASTPLHGANGWDLSIIGKLAPSSNTIVAGGGQDARIVVQNTGDTPVNLALSASPFTGGGNTWNLLTSGAPGVLINTANGGVINSCRLAAVFTTWTRVAAIGDFAADDIISGTVTTPIYPDVNALGVNSELDPTGTIKAWGVQPLQDRSIKLSFDTPMVGSGGFGIGMASNITILATSY